MDLLTDDINKAKGEERPVNSLQAIGAAFKKERERINKEIINDIMCMRDVKKMSEVQVSFLSMRQRLLEDLHILMDKMIEVRKQYKLNRGQAYNHVITDMKMRVKTGADKEALIDGSIIVAEEKAKLEILDNQILFYNESMKTVDQVLYGIKTRVEIEKMIGV